MNATLRDGIDWVGYVDWSVRNFHGYRTEQGTTYNAYLIRDEKSAIIDTVKAPYGSMLLANVTKLADLKAISYLICNHAEPDHSGSLAQLVEACPQATIVCDARCRETLAKHYATSGWKFHVVATGDSLSLGKRSLQFIETPMVHWPESMATYCPEEKLLFSMDGFGQHYATAFRFDDEVPQDVLMAEAKTYFANILMLYSGPIQRALDQIASLPCEIIAPSHGVIWRKNISGIVEAYKEWNAQKPSRKVLVVYDSMWKSTERMAQAIHAGAEEFHVDARLMHLQSINITQLATEVLDAACIAVGSPTLNMVIMPEVAGALTYLQGLKPTGKAGFAFGSYGWGKGGAQDVDAYLKKMKFQILREPLQVQFVPDAAVLEECREAGRMLARKAIETCGGAA